MPVAPNTLPLNGPPIPGVNWSEFISRGGHASSAANFSYQDGNQAILVSVISWLDLLRTIEILLGINQLVRGPGAQPWWISRTLPSRHPTYPWLYASKCSVAPCGWNSKSGNSIGLTSSYKFAQIVTTYTQPKFRMLDDATLDEQFPPDANSVRQEQNRFVEYVPQIGVEAITREGGAGLSNFKWCEGPSSGNVVITPMTQTLPKGDLILLQRRVPLYGGVLSSASNWTRADNIEAIVGSVNSAAFLGRSAQTLRFNGARIQPIEAPIHPLDMVAPFNNTIGLPSLVCDIEYSFSFWDPPPFNVTHGHNLAPIPGDTTGRWAAISPSGTVPDTTHAGIYVVKDWGKLFAPPG